VPTIEVKVAGGRWEGELNVIEQNSLRIDDAAWIPNGTSRTNTQVSATTLLIPFHLITEPVRIK